MTTFVHQFAEGNVRTPFLGGYAGKEFRSATLSLTDAEVADGNVLEFFRIPGDAVITDMYLKTDQLDTDVAPTLTLNVGHDGSATAFAAADTTVQTGGVAQLTSGIPLLPRDPTDPVQNPNDPFNIEEGTVISATFAAAAATAAAGNITLAIEYVRIP